MIYVPLYGFVHYANLDGYRSNCSTTPGNKRSQSIKTTGGEFLGVGYCYGEVAETAKVFRMRYPV